MACGCQKRANAVSVVPDNAQTQQASVEVVTGTDSLDQSVIVINGEELEAKYKARRSAEIQNDPAVKEALEIDIISCYECVKKHLSRAQAFFDEYNAECSAHAKNLMNSVNVIDRDASRAFLLWQKTQAQLDMAAGELLGNNLNEDTMRRDHIQLANDIRVIRLKFNKDPFFTPAIDVLLIRVQQLEYKHI